MFQRLFFKWVFKIDSWKRQTTIYHTVKFDCDDCNKKGLVLRQVSILNLAFWFVLGVISLFMVKWLGFNWIQSSSIAFIVWFGTTGINLSQIKPQCRHCRSTNVHMPSKTDEAELVSEGIK